MTSGIRKAEVAVVVLSAAALVLAAASSVPQGTNPSNRGVRVPSAFETVKSDFADPDMIYAPFIFWFWDEPLDADKMAGMARTLANQGFSPGYAHARRSMVGTPSLPLEQWLAEPWFAAFDAALKEAEAGGKYLGYCDEYWWPSLQACGRVLQAHPELEAVSLRWKTIDLKGGTRVPVPESFFTVAAALDWPIQFEDVPPAPSSLEVNARETHRPRTIRSGTLRIIGEGPSFNWRAPRGNDWRVYIFEKYPHAGVDGGKVNCLDERLAPAFIKAALEPYARRYGERLGASIPGDFIDHEGAFGWRLAWSETLDRRYKERYGRDIRLWMPLLLDPDRDGLFAKARWEWFDLVSDIYASQFRAVTEWHERRGMYTTLHVWEESLMPQATAVGDHMKILRAVTMPGQDCLDTKAVTPHDFKEIQSVAEFEGRRATTELLGAGGWKVFSPEFLKQSANAITAWGMSHVIPHGVFATRKLQGNPWMPDWYAENPMFPWLHLWTDFVRRTSYLNSQGHAVPDVLLYNPIESIWMLCDSRHFDEARRGPAIEWSWPEDGGFNARRGNAIDRAYSKAISDLTAGRAEFLVGDRHYVSQMEVRNGRLVRGPFEFKTVVLPPLEILPLGVAKKIVAFAKAGGRVYSLGVLPAASAENGARDPVMISLMADLRTQPTYAACPAEPPDVRAKWQYDPGWVVEGDASAYGLKPLLAAGAAGLESPVRFVSGEFPLLQQRRRIDGRDFFWLANNTGEARRSELILSGVRGAASKWDAETGSVVSLTSSETAEGSRLGLLFGPYEGFWLVFDSAAPAVAPLSAAPEPAWRNVLTIDGLWRISFDPKVQPEMEFPLTPPAEFAAGVEKPLEDWKAWGLEKFSGLLDYATTFSADLVDKKTIVKSIDGSWKGNSSGQHYILDLGRVGHAAEVWINGAFCGRRLWGPHIYDVTTALRPGRNELRVRVANLINNSYGDFRPSGLFGPVILRFQPRP